MHFVGLDLAWGVRNPTGVAVLDDTGALRHVAAVRTDEEIVAHVRDHAAGDCVVGIDAPLIVVNEAGSRPAEQALGKDFAAYQAGAHPSNTTNPAFAGGTRGARIAELLDLDMDPASTAGRRALEVYPHPATVALFRLGQTLKYKNKPGRSLDQLRGELVTLIRLLESLERVKPALRLRQSAQWHELVDTVQTATRKAQLRSAEDPIDAVICAYVALLAHQAPERVTTYGDFATGYIVTPSLPDDLEPSRQSPQQRSRAELVSAARREYAAQFPQVEQAAADAVDLIAGVLDDAGLNYLTVTGRAKTVVSFAEKAAREADGEPLYPDPLRQIGDLIGVRVITYVRSDVDAVVQLLAAETDVLDDRDMGEETASEGRFGYASRHLQLRVKDDDRLSHPEIGDRQVQVQIRTVLQHAWAEFEHDIRYKGTIPASQRPDFDRRFTLAAGLLELADSEFSTIRAKLRSGVQEAVPSEGGADRISSRELAAYLAGQYAQAEWSRADHYSWMAGLVHELGIHSLAELADELRQVDTTRIDERMAYRTPPGAVRRLDDALLQRFGEEYVALEGNAHRVERLQSRLAKLRGKP
ncbi:DUF429 domain-containing protein [Flexivirga oryzae]|uniref:Putative RNase H-like nuclease/ppGpp synthetase/RelA/SpoT-type nucleotidyltransferase n=1 Tax=Flexivirga oryzae TaxID=1794944 RepID=A0A839N960_9MICO|nr:DUF429 domain-containing protein [Flexivirga oryzae]MBB2892683.1 putative RNase H-like nuclease/ppGpp synthetase/RelA/SpoT-type nucleotidyltransferase [Flexivirga oryzae]